MDTRGRIMFKKILSLFLTLSLVIPSVGHARRTEMSYERFVHLTNEEQEKLIVLTMEMMAEIEESYTYETSTNGYNEELHEKYTSIMKKLYDFLISEANAQEATKALDWTYYADKFREAVKTSSPKDKCFFAGWPSRIQDREIVEPDVKKKPKKGKKGKTTSKKLCVVPTEIKDTNSPEYKAYKEHLDQMKKKDKCKTDEISCNPSIFGFKNSDEKSLFCVSSIFGEPTNNASHSCMKKALGLMPKTEEGADTPEKRLKVIREALKKNPYFLKSIYEYTEKLCLCNNDDVGKDKGDLNEVYLEKIKPHRTCFAMMEMMGQTLTCGDFDGKGIDLAFFESIKKFTQKDPKLLDQKYDIEKHYRNYLKSVGKKSPEYRQLCLTPEQKPEPKPEPAPKPVDPEKKSKVYTCTTEVKDCAEAPAAAAPAEGEAPAVIISCTPTVIEQSEGKTNLAKEPVTGSAGTEVDYKFKVEGEETESTVKCQLPPFKKEEPPKVPKEEAKQEEEKEPKLKLIDGDLGAKTKTAIATLEGEADGWKLVWEAKGEDAPDIQENKTIEVGKDSDDAEKPEKGPKSKKFTQVIDPVKTENKVEQPRAKADYQICAKLVKHGKSVPGDKCITVPKLEEDAPSTQASTPNLKTKSKNYPISQPQQRAPTPNRENSRWSVYGSQ